MAEQCAEFYADVFELAAGEPQSRTRPAII